MDYFSFSISQPLNLQEQGKEELPDPSQPGVPPDEDHVRLCEQDPPVQHLAVRGQ